MVGQVVHEGKRIWLAGTTQFMLLDQVGPHEGGLCMMLGEAFKF